jgi:hypothetical protein
MSESKKTSTCKKVAFLDFRPVELKLCKEWMIIYYIKNPQTNLLERKRVRVPMVQGKTERLKYAKKLVLEINKKLDEGWSPYLDTSNEKYKIFDDAIKLFVKEMEKENKDNIKRVDTLRTYNSFIKMIKNIATKRILSCNLFLTSKKSLFLNIWTGFIWSVKTALILITILG